MNCHAGTGTDRQRRSGRARLRAVPCYNLRKLNKVIAADLPERKSLLGAWREMREPRAYRWGSPGFSCG